MVPRPASGVRSMASDDLETLTDILRVARAFFKGLAEDTGIEQLVDGYPVQPVRGAPMAQTAALVRQALGLSPGRAWAIVPAGRAVVFDDGMWSVGFVDAVTTARGDAPGFLLYFVARATGWNVALSELYRPRVARRISFSTGWPDPITDPSPEP